MNINPNETYVPQAGTAGSLQGSTFATSGSALDDELTRHVQDITAVRSAAADAETDAQNAQAKADENEIKLAAILAGTADIAFKNLKLNTTELPVYETIEDARADGLQSGKAFRTSAGVLMVSFG